MMNPHPDSNPLQVIDHIRHAVNAHDLGALAMCFQRDYRSEQPFYPDRAFRGRDQMRRNWTQIFGAVPDIRAEVLRSAVDGDTVWTEWEMRGTRRDGAPHHSAMVTIGGVEGGEVAWMRLYLEPVTLGDDIEAAVQAELASGEAER